MAAAKKTVKIGSTLETTIIFPKKAVLEELAEAFRQTKKRSRSIAGTYGEKIKDAVENEHLARASFATAMKFDAMDDEKLHIEYFNLMHAFEVLGITKRATAQEEMFVSGEMSEPVGRFSSASGEDDPGADQGHPRRKRQDKGDGLPVGSKPKGKKTAAAKNGKKNGADKKPAARKKNGPAPIAEAASTVAEAAGDSTTH